MSNTWSIDNSDWALFSEDVLVDNLEFVKVITDKEGKILWAIKADGSIYWGAGIPKQVTEKFSEYEDVIDFLGEFIAGDETLQSLFDKKVDGEYIDYSEFVQVTLDGSDKILCGRTLDGMMVEKVGIKTPQLFSETLNLTHQGLMKFITDLENEGFSLYSQGIKLESLGEIWNNSLAGDTSIYFPSIINTRHQNAPGKYYMSYSYDHQYGVGDNVGIKLAYSDDLIHWTLYGNVLKAKDQFGIDTEQETETPSVIYKDGYYIMIWHSSYKYDGADYGQNSYISRSTDGINWEYVKVALRNPKERYIGDLHDGYWNAIEENGLFVAGILLGGTDYAYTDIVFSNDGYNWMLYPNNQSFRSVDNLNTMNVCNVAPILINGAYYKIGPSGKPASGSDPATYYIGIQRYAEDRMTPLGNVERLYSPSDTKETTDIRGISINVIDNKYYLAVCYRNNTNYSFFLYKILF